MDERLKGEVTAASTLLIVGAMIALEGIYEKLDLFVKLGLVFIALSVPFWASIVNEYRLSRKEE